MCGRRNHSFFLCLQAQPERGKRGSKLFGRVSVKKQRNKKSEPHRFLFCFPPPRAREPRAPPFCASLAHSDGVGSRAHARAGGDKDTRKTPRKHNGSPPPAAAADGAACGLGGWNSGARVYRLLCVCLGKTHTSSAVFPSLNPSIPHPTPPHPTPGHGRRPAQVRLGQSVAPPPLCAAGRRPGLLAPGRCARRGRRGRRARRAARRGLRRDVGGGPSRNDGPVAEVG